MCRFTHALKPKHIRLSAICIVLVGRLNTIQSAGPDTMATTQLPPPPFQQKLRFGDPDSFSAEMFCRVSRRYAEGYRTGDTEITGYPGPNTRRVIGTLPVPERVVTRPGITRRVPG